MFIKITDGRIESWANWEFQDSKFIDLDHSTFNPEKYEVNSEGNLVDITESPAYKEKKLNEAKILKQELNEKLREVEFIQTTFGKLKTSTPIGDLKIIIPNIVLIAQLQNGLPEGFLRFYNKDGEAFSSQKFTQVQALTLYGEIVAFYNALDLKSTQITNSIKAASSLEELNAIEINY